MSKPSSNQVAIDRLRNIASALHDWEISAGYMHKNLLKSIKDYEQCVLDFETMKEEDLR